MIRSILLAEGKLQQEIDPKDWRAVAEKPGNCLWVDVEAPRRKALGYLKEAFGFDSISLADTQTLSKLPKLDVFKDYAFLVIHALSYDEASGTIVAREFDMFLGKGYLVTVHGEPLPSVDKVFKEATKSDAVLSRGPDVLAHVLLDRLIDLAYEMVSVFDDDIEQMENQIEAAQFEGVVAWQLRMRKALLTMRKAVGPQRDVLNLLARRESPFISPDASVYFRSDYDRLSRVFDMVDTNRELVANAAEAYRSMVSLQISEVTLRTNAVIEWLTLFAGIFLPLTFFAGVYGMNFDEQREYSTPGFYPYVMWSIFIIFAVVMILFFWRKGWISILRKAERTDYVPDAPERRPPEG